MTDKSHASKVKNDEAKDSKVRDSKAKDEQANDANDQAVEATYPEASGTDSGQAHSATAAPQGSSGATTSAMVGSNPTADHGIEDKNFDKDTGFWTESK